MSGIFPAEDGPQTPSWVQGDEPGLEKLFSILLLRAPILMEGSPPHWVLTLSLRDISTAYRKASSPELTGSAVI